MNNNVADLLENCARIGTNTWSDALLAELFLFPAIGLWIARGSKKRVVP
jgi:hypothetical protein